MLLKAVLIPVITVLANDVSIQIAFAQSDNKIPPDVMTRYTVVEGDNLSKISEQDMVYGDANLWPLIFKYNTDKLTDPDKLEPGLVLVIPRNMSQAEIHEAASYAKKRKNMSSDLVRERDLEYLQSQ
jgi:nucleoid-associated protein YgaU